MFAMKKKDLAEEYLDRKIKQEPFKSLTKGFEYAFSVDDIKAAFNAGRESVFDTLPKLLFKELQEGLVAEAHLLNEYYHVYKSASVEEPRYTFAFEYEKPTQWYDTLEEAMDAANNDYRERIKRALGL